ncbi:CD276 antigen-like [Rana temporaria]|uniref:CD276 antigen-like n=1 Tax=Rana temporaria TaxID=8407 RepID=UPI001AACF1E1|nr:CD276 antigen-like [Rana temporaria]
MRSAQISGEMIALGLLLTIFCPYMAHSKGIHIEEMNLNMEAWLGQNLTIPCALAKDADQDLDLDLSTVGVRWSKISLNRSKTDVYKFTGHSHEEIRPGSAIDENELKRGNASLTLHHVQRSDEGEYSCTIFVTPNKASDKRNVTVLAKPNITLSITALPIEPGRKESVICEVSKFYPEAVKIQWGKHNKSSGTWSLLDKPTYRTEIQENSDGSFNVSSQLVVEPSSPEENGDVYYCVVTHGSFSHDQNVSFTLIVKELSGISFLEVKMNIMLIGFAVLVGSAIWLFLYASPEVSEIVGLDDLVHMQTSSLTFMVSGFRLKNIEIHLYLKRTDSRVKIKSWKYPLPPPTIQYKGDPKGGESLSLAYNQVGSSLESEIQPLKPRGSFLSYSCLCSTDITPDKDSDEGAKLVVEVIHSAKKKVNSVIVCQKMQISEAEQVGEPIPLKHQEHQVGQ